MSFRLEPTVPTLQLVMQPEHRDPATGALSAAMRALLSGDHEQLERLEVEYLNVLVRIGEFGVRYPDGTPMGVFGPSRARRDGERHPFVDDILRCATPDARTLLVWTLAEPCRRCLGRLRHAPCRICDGRWYVDRGQDSEWLIYTDVDGVLVRDDR